MLQREDWTPWLLKKKNLFVHETSGVKAMPAASYSDQSRLSCQSRSCDSLCPMIFTSLSVETPVHDTHLSSPCQNQQNPGLILSKSQIVITSAWRGSCLRGTLETALTLHSQNDWFACCARSHKHCAILHSLGRESQLPHCLPFSFSFLPSPQTNFNCCPYALPITPTIHTTPAGLPAHIRQIRPGDVAHNSSRLLMVFMWCKFLLTACKYFKEDNWAPDTFGCTVKRLLLPFLKCADKATGAKRHLNCVHKLSALCNISAALFGFRRLYGDIAAQHDEGHFRQSLQSVLKLHKAVSFPSCL